MGIMDKSFLKVYLKVGLVFLFIAVSINPVYSSGKQEKNEIITYKSSSSGTIYQIDYSPPEKINLENVHYIQIKIYDSSGNSYNEIYYLTSNDVKSEEHIFNMVFPHDYFFPEKDLTISIDYYSENTTPLGSVSEQFTPVTKLVFATVEQNENSIGPYRISNKIREDNKAVLSINSNPENTELLNNFFGNILKEIREILLDNNKVYIVIKKTVYIAPEFDISELKTINSEHRESLDKYTRILNDFLTANFPYKTNSSQAEKFYSIETILQYDSPASVDESRWPPFFQIYLLNKDNEAAAIQNDSYDITMARIESAFDNYIIEKYADSDSTIAELIEKIKSTITKNIQASKYYQNMNRHFMDKLSLFDAALKNNQEVLNTWIEKTASIATTIREEMGTIEERINELQERQNTVKEKAINNLDKHTVASSNQKEMEFLDNELKNLEALYQNNNNNYDTIVNTVKTGIEAVNSTDTHFILSKESTDVFGPYNLLYDNQDALQSYLEDIENFNSILDVIISISTKEEDAILTNLPYSPDQPNLSTANLEDIEAQIEDLLDKITMADEKRAEYGDRLVSLQKDISTDFERIKQFTKDNNSSLILAGIDPDTDIQFTDSQDIDEVLIKLLRLNEYLNNVLYRSNDGKTIRQPLYMDVYTAIQQVPDTDKLTARIHSITRLPTSGYSDVDNLLSANQGTLTQDILKPDNIGTLDQLTHYQLASNVSISSIVAHIENLNPGIQKDETRHIIDIYFDESRKEDINPLVAIAQMLHHTKNLKNRNIVEKSYNFGQLGTGNSISKWTLASFTSTTEGIRAHIQHIKAYATTDPIKAEIVDPRYSILDKKGLIGSKPALIDMLGAWYSPKSSEQSYNTIVEILKKLTD